MIARMSKTTAAMTLCALALAASPARAADTIESWAKGAWDLDVYLGYDGIGRRQDARSLGSELMGGYGITDRLAIYLGLAITAKEALDGAEAGAYLGVFYTAVDTEHFDLDLALDFDAEGPGMSLLGFNPYLELNLDSNNDMSGVGAYVRAAVGLDGDADRGWQDTFGVGLEFTLGVYVTVAADHMIFVEAGAEVNPMAGDGETIGRIASTAMGYNLVLSDLAELVTEVGLGLPTGGELLSGRVTLGVIFTIGADA